MKNANPLAAHVLRIVPLTPDQRCNPYDMHSHHLVVLPPLPRPHSPRIRNRHQGWTVACVPAKRCAVVQCGVRSVLLCLGALWCSKSSTIIRQRSILTPLVKFTYLPHAILSQLTVTYIANTPASAHPLGLSGLRIASYGQLFGWLSQFAGHGFAEGRAPALLDNLLQGASCVIDEV